jgi:SAM-dependent methyltransferase
MDKNNHWQLINKDGSSYLALPDGRTIPTHHSQEALWAIYEAKNPEGFHWFVDEVQRGEFPNNISEHLRRMVTRLQLQKKSSVLDFGAGSGASSIALAHLGFNQIDTVEIDRRLIEIARLRARDFGFQDNINLHCIEAGERLPFADESFEIVVCYAVIEHIHPNLRRQILQDLWRVLKRRGVMLILETPNILFPYGNHYPFLYFTPWMPLPMVKAYGRWRGRIEGEISDEDLYLAGLRGATVWQILRDVGGAGRLLPDLSSNWEEEYLRDARMKPGRMAKRALKQIIIRAYQVFLKPLGVPFCAIFPQLNFGIEKLS